MLWKSCSFFNFSCPWRLPTDVNESSIIYLKKLDNDSNSKMTKILNCLTAADKIDLCSLSQIAIPEVYPLIYNHLPEDSNIFDFYLSGQNQTIIISEYLEERPEFLVPKHIVITMGTYKMYLPPRITYIPKWKLDRFNLEAYESADHYIVTKKPNCGTDDEHSSLIEDNVDVSENLSSIDGESEFHRSLANDFDQCTEERSQSSEHFPANDDSTSGNLQSHIELSRPENISRNSNACLVDNNVIEDQRNDADPDNSLQNEAYSSDRPTSQSNDHAHEETSGNINNTDAEHVMLSEETIQKVFPDYAKVKKRKSSMWHEPESLSNKDCIHLIHMTKQDFLILSERIRPHLKENFAKSLSVHALTFLFRYKLVTNLSFVKLASHFVISEPQAIKIFYQVLSICHKHLLAIPKFLDNKQVLSKLFEDTYNALDPFFRALFSKFADPKGTIYLNISREGAQDLKRN